MKNIPKLKEGRLSMFKKILVAIDGSEQSVKAARAAIDIASKNGGEIHLLHVVRPPAFDYSGVDFTGSMLPPEIPDYLIDEWSKVGQLILDKARKEVESEDVQTTIEVGMGDPAQVICDTAEKGNYELIVMGRRGVGGLGGLLLGSVSNRVLQLASCPVLIVH